MGVQIKTPKLKSPNEIRLFIDMRDANRAILITRHISPTIDELSADLNGVTAFSKLDLKSGYHQLELHPSCRYITTFSTHLRLYQCNRLSFGINSAAEIFQHTIQTLMPIFRDYEMLVTTSCFMAETKTSTTPHSTKCSADFTSPASP